MNDLSTSMKREDGPKRALIRKRPSSHLFDPNSNLKLYMALGLIWSYRILVCFPHFGQIESVETWRFCRGTMHKNRLGATHTL